MTKTDPPELTIDVLDRTLYSDGFPHDIFTPLRQAAPLYRQPWPSGLREHSTSIEQADTLWHAFSHAAVRQTNRDWERFSARSGPTISRTPEGSAGMLGTDPPEHHRLRQTVSSAFTPRMIGRLEERIDARIDDLLDAVDGEECNFVDALAYPLPMHVIADIIGIPESDRGFVFSKTKDVLDSLDPEHVHEPGADPDDISPDLFTYAMELSERKRAHPEDDVWSKIIEAGLPAVDVDVFFLILSIAGSETTRSALSHGFLALLSDTSQIDQIAADPTLMDRTGTDEIVRYTSPVLVFARDITVDIEVLGCEGRPTPDVASRRQP